MSDVNIIYVSTISITLICFDNTHIGITAQAGLAIWRSTVAWYLTYRGFFKYRIYESDINILTDTTRVNYVQVYLLWVS